MSGDVIRKPRPEYSLANEKLVQNSKKLQSRPNTEVIKTLYLQCTYILKLYAEQTCFDFWNLLFDVSHIFVKVLKAFKL